MFGFSPYRTRRARYRILGIVAVILIGLMVFMLWPTPKPVSTMHIPKMPKDASSLEKVIVMGKRRSEDVTWLEGMWSIHDYTSIIYSTSYPPEPGCLTPRSRRGREAATYLSYVLDYYDALPAYSFFIHDARDQWHNDIVGKLTSDALRQVRKPAVDRDGFVNLRCKMDPGCPPEVFPFDEARSEKPYKNIMRDFPRVYMEIFGVAREEVPKAVGGVCCAQFVVSREQIRKRPKSDYERMLRWVDETSLTDSFGVGWVFEKVWHIVFSMETTHCPDYEQCRCDLYGWCGPLYTGKTYKPVM